MYKHKYIKYKNKYIAAKYKPDIQNGGYIYESKRSGKKYVGAGILLIDLYNNNKGEEKLTTILFESNRKTGKFFEDLGGGLSKQDIESFYPLATCAVREAFEESRGLIYFQNPLHIGSRVGSNDAYVDLQTNNNTYYRCYIVCLKKNLINESAFKNYYSNIKILDNNKNVPFVMKESHNITRFYIDELIKNGILNTDTHFITKDINNKVCTVYKRTTDIIKAAYKNGIFNIVKNYPKEMVKLNTLVSI